MGKEVIWSPKALGQLESIHSYVFERSKSLQIADKLINEIFDSSDILGAQPEMFHLDKYKTNNKGNYRAYEINGYRITYRITKLDVRIIRARHASRDPEIL
jgi:plasmid stabilization system protein ParE